ncbi:hypothetical protein IU449_06350 [Nocardia higoensis]|uniref:Mce-associated membrane protein n=1 Tax=Nocardia higoensis TaxID=228599 RepID=A0ABS0DB96_9NOCA|nr:hypothetical protein [Nocardia higoensis]
MTQLTDSDNRAGPGSPGATDHGGRVDTPPDRSLDPTADRAAARPPNGRGPSPGPNDAPACGGAPAILDELRLAAEEAEAEAVAAEAVAAAALARARATRLRRRATTAAGPGAAVEAPEALRPGADTIASSGADRGPATAPVPTPAPASVPVATGVGPEDAAEPEDSAPPADRASATTADLGSGDIGSGDIGTGDIGTGAADHGTAVPTDAVQSNSASVGHADERSAEDDSTAERSEHESTVASSVRSRRAPSARALVSAVAVAVIAVSGTVSGLLVHHHQQTVQANQRETEFAEAARQGVVALTSLDFRRAEQDVQRVLEHSTGAFRDDFESRSQDFTSVIQQSQVATAGTVNSAAVESMAEDSAVVLVAATSQVTNAAGAQEEPRVWRLSVTVTRAGDTIKMSKVEFVP